MGTVRRFSASESGQKERRPLSMLRLPIRTAARPVTPVPVPGSGPSTPQEHLVEMMRRRATRTLAYKALKLLGVEIPPRAQAMRVILVLKRSLTITVTPKRLILLIFI